MAYEDLSTFVEVDDWRNDIVLSSTTCTHSTMARDSIAYAYRSYGAGYFTDFIVEWEGGPFDSSGYGGAFIGWMCLTNNPATQLALTNGVWVRFYGGWPTRCVYLFDAAMGTSDSYTEDKSTFDDKTLYYRLTRSGTTAQLFLFSDAARTILLDTLTVTCSATAFEYLMPGLGYGGTGSQLASSRTKNVRIISAGATAKPWWYYHRNRMRRAC